MATKGNLKSIRLSDDLIELIEQQAGATFTAKLENLVTRCVWELPEKERQLENIKEQIQKEQEQLRNMQDYYKKLNWVFKDMERKAASLTVSINTAIKELDS